MGDNKISWPDNIPISSRARAEYGPLLTYFLQTSEILLVKDGDFRPFARGVTPQGTNFDIFPENNTVEGDAHSLWVKTRDASRNGDIAAICQCQHRTIGQNGGPGILFFLDRIQGPSVMVRRAYTRDTSGEIGFSDFEWTRIPPEIFHSSPQTESSGFEIEGNWPHNLDIPDIKTLQLTEMINLHFNLTEQWLQNAGTFAPCAAVLDSKGKMSGHVAETTQDIDPIAYLEQILKQVIRKNHGAAVCFCRIDTVVISGTEYKAISLEVEHRTGVSFALKRPFYFSREGDLTFLEILGSRRGRLYFSDEDPDKKTSIFGKIFGNK